MTDNIFWNLELSIKSDLDTLTTLMNDMVAGTKNDEPGALNYEWFISEDKKTCHIYERYQDSDVVMTHLGNFGEKYGERFLAALEPIRFQVYGEPSAEVVEALAGFGAVHLKPLGGFTR